MNTPPSPSIDHAGPRSYAWAQAFFPELSMRPIARVLTILTASFALVCAACGDEHAAVLPEAELDAVDCPRVCDPNASCLPSPTNEGRCRCNAGWMGDGESCVQPTSCDDHNGGCHPKATCAQGQDALSCECAYGFEGDGYACAPPAGGYVKLAGSLSLDYATAGCAGNAVWAFDLRFNGQGTRFATTGPVDGGVWKAEASVDFVDFDTGELTLDFQAHTWLDHSCPGRVDFRWANAKDAERAWTNVPVSADLQIFGEDIPWYWSAGDVSVSEVKSTLVATFEKP